MGRHCFLWPSPNGTQWNLQNLPVLQVPLGFCFWVGGVSDYQAAVQTQMDMRSLRIIQAPQEKLKGGFPHILFGHMDGGKGRLHQGCREIIIIAGDGNIPGEPLKIKSHF